jgi:hypothetical protein
MAQSFSVKVIRRFVMRKLWTPAEYQIAHDLYEDALAKMRLGHPVNRSKYVQIGTSQMKRTEGSLRWIFGNITVAREELGIPTAAIFGRADHRANKLVDWYRSQLVTV